MVVVNRLIIFADCVRAIVLANLGEGIFGAIGIIDYPMPAAFWAVDQEMVASVLASPFQITRHWAGVVPSSFVMCAIRSLPSTVGMSVSAILTGVAAASIELWRAARRYRADVRFMAW